MTDQPPTGDQPEPKAPEPPAPEAAPTEPDVPPSVPPSSPEPSVPQWTSAEAAPAAPAFAPFAPDAAQAPPSEAASIAAAPVVAAAAAATPPPAPVAPAPAAAQPPAQPAWNAPPPAPPRTAEVPGAPGRYFAITVTRVAALLVDTILLAILAGIVIGILSALVPGQFMLDPEATTPTFGPGFAIAGLGGLVISYLYFFLSWRSGGKATPGQRVFKMQVGNAFDGAALTPRQITIRWLALFGLSILSVLPILAGLGGLLAFIWDIVLLVTTASSLTKQGLHDRWAGSAVVATGPQNTTLAWGCLIAYVVGILLLIAVAAVLLLVVAAAFYSLQ